MFDSQFDSQTKAQAQKCEQKIHTEHVFVVKKVRRRSEKWGKEKQKVAHSRTFA